MFFLDPVGFTSKLMFANTLKSQLEANQQEKPSTKAKAFCRRLGFAVGDATVFSSFSPKSVDFDLEA